MAPGTPKNELRRIGDLWVRVDHASPTGGYRDAGAGVPTIVATADRPSTLWGIVFLAMMTVLMLGTPMGMAYLVLFHTEGGEWTFNPIVAKILVCGFLLGIAVLGGRILLRAMRDSLRQLRQPTVFQLDAQALTLAGQELPRESIREIVVERCTIEGTTFRVVARIDEASLWLVSGLENEEDARWLEAQIGVPGDSSSGSDGRRRS